MTHDHLIQFATVRQIEFIDAIKEHGAVAPAAKALGVDPKTIRNSLNALEVKAARKQPTSHDYAKSAVPDGFGIKGVSQYIKDGEVKGQWVKTSADAERQLELIKLAVEALCSDIKPLKLIAPPSHTESDLMNVIPMGDPHFGMMSWGAETGADFDLKIAEELTLGAVENLIQRAPKAKTCVLLPLGDNFHTNDQKNATPGHGHQLDVDGRYAKILWTGILAFRHLVIRALETHDNVIVRCVGGNHDREMNWGLAYAMAGFFHGNPRVKLELSPNPFWYHKHGRVLIASTHGDKTKPEQLPGIMATDHPKWWGETEFRYWYTGHIHSSNSKEFPGVTWESFRTLASGDAYAHSNGYRSLRDMHLITQHAELGEVERRVCNIKAIK